MEAVIFTGIQAAGKSTFYAENFADTHIRINLDMLKTRKREIILLHACLAAEQPFVVDNTNTTREQRAKYIGLAKAAGFKVIGYFFDIEPEEAIKRNKNREREVPLAGIRRAIKSLVPPEKEEGFDEIHTL